VPIAECRIECFVNYPVDAEIIAWEGRIRKDAADLFHRLRPQLIFERTGALIDRSRHRKSAGTDPHMRHKSGLPVHLPPRSDRLNFAERFRGMSHGEIGGSTRAHLDGLDDGQVGDGGEARLDAPHAPKGIDQVNEAEKQNHGQPDEPQERAPGTGDEDGPGADLSRDAAQYDAQDKTADSPNM